MKIAYWLILLLPKTYIKSETKTLRNNALGQSYSFYYDSFDQIAKKTQQKQHKNSLFHNIFDLGAPWKGHVTPKNMFDKVIDSKVLLNFV